MPKPEEVERGLEGYIKIAELKNEEQTVEVYARGTSAVAELGLLKGMLEIAEPGIGEEGVASIAGIVYLHMLLTDDELKGNDNRNVPFK